jgi:hypothetical protein
MDGVVCRFAVGSQGGPRSASYCLYTASGGTEIRVATRAGGAPFTATIPACSAQSCRPGGDRPLTRECLRQAITAGSWAAGDRFIAEWTGSEISPEVCERFVVCLPGSALRRFVEAPGAPEPTWIEAPPEFGQVNVSVLVGIDLAAWRPAGHAILGRRALADGREVVAACSTERAPSRMQKAGLFSAIRKRPPPELSQAVLVQPGTRLVLIWQLDGRGVFTEIAGDMFFSPGSC